MRACLIWTALSDKHASHSCCFGAAAKSSSESNKKPDDDLDVLDLSVSESPALLLPRQAAVSLISDPAAPMSQQPELKRDGSR